MKKIGILSKSEYIYSTQLLCKTLQLKGFDIDLINPFNCDVFPTQEGIKVFRKGKEIAPFDFIIPRIGAGSETYGLHILKSLESQGIKTLNPGSAIENVRCKFNVYRILSQNNLPIVKTALVKTSMAIDYVEEELGPYPIIIKLARGSQGKGVMIAESRHSLKSTIEAMSLLGEDFIAQEYIHTTPKHTDIRVMVLNQEVIASVQRENTDDFRSNTHCGGQMSTVLIPKEVKEVALKASQILGLNFCSVDFLFQGETYKILEINTSPGFEYIHKQANINIAAYIGRYIEQQLCQPSINV